MNLNKFFSEQNSSLPNSSLSQKKVRVLTVRKRKGSYNIIRLDLSIVRLNYVHRKNITFAFLEESFFKFCFWRVNVVLCTLRLQYGADINIDNRFSHPRFTLFNLSLLQKPILALGFAFTGQDEITLLKTSELFSHVTELVPLSVLMKAQPEPWAPVPVAHRGNLFLFWSIKFNATKKK